MSFVLERQMPTHILAVSAPAVRDIRHKAQLKLLKHAQEKLSRARECRELAAAVNNSRAASILGELAIELETRAQRLAARAEKIT